MTNQGQTPPAVPRQHEYPSRYQDDEISLVDLARILVKRWKLIAVIFLVVVLGALAYALMMERTYEYVSIYQVAEQGLGSGLESPSTIVAKTSNLYLGPVNRELPSTAGLERLPFDVSVSIPKDTQLIRLSSQTAETHSELVAEMHDALLARVKEGQQQLLERRRENLQNQLASAERSLEGAQQSTRYRYSAGDLIISYANRVSEIEASLNQLREGEIVQVAVQSQEPKGTSRSLIMALALVLGGMLALMSAFFAQFVAAVRDSFNEDGFNDDGFN